ncbi:hypothetical protein ALP90_200242 [Pseudomonas amygdali pv. ulmi]|uniref:Uncharacterized protein n=1 Tax=Pseudomonas amygdali pv. ulmi TaxID=251720 RepID=A0A3M4S7P5_PSEA0|nr:hypothetical protein ALP90_200242 [Pseudomonas amygdali pv. ulmi]
MPRLMLSDEHWPKLREILLHESIYNKRDLRTTVEGMLYHMRVGCPTVSGHRSRYGFVESNAARQKREH